MVKGLKFVKKKESIFIIYGKSLSLQQGGPFLVGLGLVGLVGRVGGSLRLSWVSDWSEVLLRIF